MLLGGEHHFHGAVHLGEKFLEGEIEGPQSEPLRSREARSRHLEVPCRLISCRPPRGSVPGRHR
jgi:hypothetical protein